MRGGKRDGAGRKAGVPNKRTQEKVAAIEASGLTPLDYMLSVLRDELLDRETRLEAAKSAAPYVHAKLASVDTKLSTDGPLTIEIVRFGEAPPSV
jgi:hypothetical protein